MIEIPPVNSKVTMTLLDYFGRPAVTKATIMSSPYLYGFRTKCGAWSLYGGLDGDIPCHYVDLRMYRRRRICRVPVDEILDIKVGWDYDQA
jgi:hypothetical protein